MVSPSHTIVAEISVTKCAICGGDLKPYIEKTNIFGITKSKERIAFKHHSAIILAQLNSEGFLPLSSVGPEYNF